MGKFYVIDGLDGSGKATQTKLLGEYLKNKGRDFLKISFPNYESRSCELVKMYLEGEISSNPSDINAYAATSFYACDRYISFKTEWEKDYLSDKTILSDRYVSSNIIHQMSKLPKEEWDKYIEWTYDYEFGRLRLPKADKTIYLSMSTEVSKKLMTQRYNGDESKRDIHENDYEYLLKCKQAAEYSAKKLGWTVIICDDGENPLSIDEISDKIIKSLNL